MIDDHASQRSAPRLCRRRLSRFGRRFVSPLWFPVWSYCAAFECFLHMQLIFCCSGTESWTLEIRDVFALLRSIVALTAVQVIINGIAAPHRPQPMISVMQLIMKAAGCSVVSDLSSMVGRENIYSYETCFRFSDSANFTALQDTVVMVRQPREHVFSQYQFCKLATDPGYRRIVRYLEGLPGEKNFHMTISFQKWMEEWTRSPRYGSYSILEDHEFCFCPHNLQASRLACKNETLRSATVDLDAAKHSLDAATMLGVTEAYHESVCLFHAHLLGELPDHCNCESPDDWNSYKETKETHGESYQGSIEDMPRETIAQVDAMTQQDKAIYQRGVKRFIADVKKMEKRFGTKILCQERLKMLDQKANY
eukprot:s624_g30.t1